MLYNNVSPYTYDMELLVLVDCVESNKDKSGQTFELFGATHTECDGNNEELIETYSKELDYPIYQRNALVIAFIRMQQSVSLIIFEDGHVSQLKNHENTGIIKSDQLKMPFGNVNAAIYEEDTGLLCMQTIQKQRSFFICNEGTWGHLSDHQKGKLQFMKIIGKFAIARHQDKYTYLIEMNENQEMILDVRLGDDDTWNYAFDADAKFSQFVILYEKSGKGFRWQKYDK